MNVQQFFALIGRVAPFGERHIGAQVTHLNHTHQMFRHSDTLTYIYTHDHITWTFLMNSSNDIIRNIIQAETLGINLEHYASFIIINLNHPVIQATLDIIDARTSESQMYINQLIPEPIRHYDQIPMNQTSLNTGSHPSALPEHNPRSLPIYDESMSIDHIEEDGTVRPIPFYHSDKYYADLINFESLINDTTVVGLDPPVYVINAPNHRSLHSGNTYKQNGDRLFMLSPDFLRQKKLSRDFYVRPSHPFGDPRCHCYHCCSDYNLEQLGTTTCDFSGQSHSAFIATPDSTPLSTINRYIRHHWPSHYRNIRNTVAFVFEDHEINGHSFQQIFAIINFSAQIYQQISNFQPFIIHSEWFSTDCPTTYSHTSVRSLGYDRLPYIENLRLKIVAYFQKMEVQPLGNIDRYIYCVDVLQHAYSPSRDGFPLIHTAHVLFEQLALAKIKKNQIFEIQAFNPRFDTWNTNECVVLPTVRQCLQDLDMKTKDDMPTRYAPSPVLFTEDKSHEITRMALELFNMKLYDGTRHGEASAQAGFTEMLTSTWTMIAGNPAGDSLSLMSIITKFSGFITEMIQGITAFMTNKIAYKMFGLIYKAFKSFLTRILGQFGFLAKRVIQALVEYFSDPMHIAHVFQLLSVAVSENWKQFLFSITGLIISIGLHDNVFATVQELSRSYEQKHAVQQIIRNVTDHLDFNIAESQGPPQEMDEMRLAETAFALASVLILGKTYSTDSEKADSARSFKEWLSEYSQAGRAFSNVMMAGRHMKDIFGFFRDLFFSAAYWIFGQSGVNAVYSRLLTDLPDKITLWAGEVIRVSDPALKHKVLISPAFRNEINNLYLQSKLIQQDILRIPSYTISTMLVSRLISTITDLQSLAICSGQATARIDPHCVVFYGAPGFGKSYVMMKLTRHICRRRGWTANETVYNLGAGAKHMDGYEPAIHKIHVVDDMSQFCQPDTDSGPMVMQAKTNSAYNTPQANVDAKGKKYYSCEYIVGSANNPFPTHVGVLRTDSAFYRRRNLLVKVTFNQTWKRESGYATAEERNENPELSEFLTEAEQKTLNHLRFTMVHPNPFQPGEVVLGQANMTYAQFLAIYDEKTDRYLANQESLLRRINEEDTDPEPEPAAEPQGLESVLDWFRTATPKHPDPLPNEPRWELPTFLATSNYVDPDTYALHEKLKVRVEYKDQSVIEALHQGTPYPIEFLNMIKIRECEEPSALIRIKYAILGRGDPKYSPTDKPIKVRYQWYLDLPDDFHDWHRYAKFWNGINSLPYSTKLELVECLYGIARADDDRQRYINGVSHDLDCFRKKASRTIKTMFNSCKAYTMANKKFFIVLAISAGLGYIAYSQGRKLFEQERILLDANLFHKYVGADGTLVDPPAGEAESYSQHLRHQATTHVKAVPESTAYSNSLNRLRTPKILSESTPYNTATRHLPRHGAIHVAKSQGAEFDYSDSMPEQVVPLPERTAVPQGCEDPNAMQSLRGLYSRNMVNLYFTFLRKDNSVSQFQVAALGIEGSIVLAPKHFFHDSRISEDTQIFVTGWGCSKIVVPYRPEWLTDVTQDLVLYYLGPRYPSFRSGILEGHLIREHELCKVPRKCAMILAGVRVDENDDMPTREVHLGVGGFIDARARSAYKAAEVDNELIFVRQGYKYEAITERGDCGKLLIAINTGLPHKILGMHTHGWDKENLGGAIAITYEQVKKALAETELRLFSSAIRQRNIMFAPEKGHPGCEELPINPDGTLAAVHNYDDEDTAMQVAPMGTYTLLGSVDKKWSIAQTTKTELRPSLIHGRIQEPTHAPAALCRAQAPGCPTTPLVEAISKFGKIVLPFPSSDVDAAVEHTTHLLKDVLVPKYRPPQIASLDEAINGIRAPSGAIVENFRGMEMSTSAGYPHRLPHRKPDSRPGKHSYFKLKEGSELEHEISDPQLLAEIEEKELYAKKGMRLPSVTMDVLKDELRSVQKVHLGKTRAINVMPLPFVILFRRYFLDFKNSFCESHGKFFGCVGTDAHGPDWTDLWNKLKTISPDGFAGDYANWDGTIEAFIMMQVANIISDWYDDGEEARTVRQVLLHEIIHTVHLAQNSLYMKHQGNPSGCPLTVELNCICNFVYSLIVWRISCREAGRLEMLPLRKFDENVCCFNYGDDNIFAVSDEAREFFNQITFSNVLARHGITYTRADKTETTVEVEPLENLSFLKRGFVPHPRRPNIILAPIEKATIYRMIDWVRKSKDPELMIQQNVNDALDFAYHWNVEFYDRFKSEVNTACRKAGVRTNSTTWKDHDEIFLAKFDN